VLTLLVLQGPDKGQRFELPDESIVVGRGSRQIPLTDNTISRRHCEIAFRDGACVLTDAGSSNGTFINGLKLRSAQALHVGDQLRIGRTLMVVGTTASTRSTAGEVEFSTPESGMDSAIMHTVGANDDSLVLSDPDPSAAAVNNLRVLYRLAAALGSTFDVDQAMAITLDLIFGQVRADRGVIMLKAGGALGRLEAKVVRMRDRAAPPEIRPSSTIVDHVATSGEGVLSTNAMTDARFSKGKSIHDLGIRSAICVPIKARRPGATAAQPEFEVLGVIYIDSSVKNYTYTPEQLRLLSAIGMQAGMAVQNARLYQAGIRAERLAAVGETTAALSHSIKNILQALRGGGDVVEMGLASGNVGQASKGWGVVSRNLGTIYSLALNLLAYSRPRVPRTEMVVPGNVIREVLETVGPNAAAARVRLIPDVDPDHPPVPMDADGIQQVLMNLVGNALDAVAPDAGVIRVVSRFDAAAEESVIEVVDNGPGIAPAMMASLFELFHSTKGNRGTGLGLAVSKKIVDEHEGTLTGANLPGGGAVFTIRLPVRRLPDASDLHAQESGAPG
jgi:signal transduction histidine kinase/pSer/pThr/pTyr-binding forkhead associated (FHA) protein